MSDYIKREDAERLLRYDFLSALTEDERVDELNRIPSADVVEVVRCKDCENYNGEVYGGEFGLCNLLRKAMHEMNWCCFGARMDGEEDE